MTQCYRVAVSKAIERERRLFNKFYLLTNLIWSNVLWMPFVLKFSWQKKLSLNEHLGMILIGTKLVKLYIQQLFLSITPSNTPAVNIIKH